jgi:hypothetical protein
VAKELNDGVAQRVLGVGVISGMALGLLKEDAAFTSEELKEDRLSIALVLGMALFGGHAAPPHAKRATIGPPAPRTGPT